MPGSIAELLNHVRTAINHYRTGEIDAYAINETIHHRTAAELWKFCGARGGGTPSPNSPPASSTA